MQIIENDIKVLNMIQCIFLHMALLLSIFTSLHADQNTQQPIPSCKKALIFGVAGQDGTYLAEFLLKKNYEVHGISRSLSSAKNTFCTRGYDDILLDNPNFILHEGNILSATSVIKLIDRIQPDEIYNLAGQSNVKTSFELPVETTEVNALGTLRILEALKLLGFENKIKLFQAASSELYGTSQKKANDKNKSYHPRSPYGISKLYSYWITVIYREAYGLFACNGILFNHESPFRSEAFVTRKITSAACRYKLGLQDILYLGNLDTRRDWGYAKDYVEAMWLMLQQENSDDYVIATGETHSVREFVELAFEEMGVNIEWHGKGVNEYGIDKKTGQIIVKIDPLYYRPNDADSVIACTKDTEKKLNWKPSTTFQNLVQLMMEEDYRNHSMQITSS